MNTILTILTGLAIQTSTFDGLPYTVTSSMYCDTVFLSTRTSTLGCYSEERGIEVETHSENVETLYHEESHAKFQWVFNDDFNAPNSYTFWEERPFVPKTNPYYRCFLEGRPWESMARWYSYFMRGNIISQDMIDWFMYSEKDYDKHKEEYQKLKMKIVWKIKK